MAEKAGRDGVISARHLQPGVTTKEGGSGFGLFLARRIADDAGGHLEIGNLETGGACVQVALPCVGKG